MMRKDLLVRSLLVAAALFVSSTLAFAEDNWVGSWKLNVAKSKVAEGAIRAETLKFEATPAGIKLTSNGTDAEGKPMQGGYVSKFDGKDVPWAGNPQADTASPKRIDANNYENVWKKAGKATVTAKVSVSADGKTLTVTQAGKVVAVYDKQ
jgi:hypothetical protein